MTCSGIRLPYPTSRDRGRFANKLLSAMRAEFGGHPEGDRPDRPGG